MSDELWQRRFLLLVSQYAAEHGDAWGWKSKLAERLGQAPSTLNKVTTDARPVTKGMVTAAIMKFPIDAAFFYDEGLGDAPDYHDFVGRTVDRDDAKGTPNAEAYIAGQAAIGRPVSDEHAKRLRSIRASTGDLPLATFAATHSAWLAEDAGKVVERRGEPIPTKIDEARGQRRLPPAKPRR